MSGSVDNLSSDTKLLYLFAWMFSWNPEEIVHVCRVQGIDKYIWLVGQVMSEPAVKKLVSVVEGGMDPSSYRESVVAEPLDQHAQASSQLPNMPFSFSDVGEGPAKRSRESEQMVSRTASVVQQFHNFGLDDRQSESASWVNSRSEKYLDVPKPLIEGVSYPATPHWNIDRPYLTGQHLFQVFLFYWNLNSVTQLPH
jgi:hypothetical protein